MACAITAQARVFLGEGISEHYDLLIYTDTDSAKFKIPNNIKGYENVIN